MSISLPTNYDELSVTNRRLVREHYAKLQKFKCHYCKADLDGDPAPEVKARELNMLLFPPNFLKWPVHLHHCHKTGMTIGSVHAYCNGVLWQYHGE